MPSDTLLRTARRNADWSVVGGLVISRNAVRNVVNRKSESETLMTVRINRRLLRSALIRFNPERTGSAWPVLEPLLNTLEKLGLYSAEKREVLRQQPEALEGELLASVFHVSFVFSVAEIRSFPEIFIP